VRTFFVQKVDHNSSLLWFCPELVDSVICALDFPFILIAPAKRHKWYLLIFSVMVEFFQSESQGQSTVAVFLVF